MQRKTFLLLSKHFVFLSICGTFPQSAFSSCPFDWFALTPTKCVRLHDDLKPYHDASQICSSYSDVSHSPQMITIKTPAEQTLVTEWLSKQTSVLITPADSVWLGGARRSGNKFGWVDGSDFSFSSWAPSFPSKDAGNNGCVELLGASRNWRDIPCKKRNFVLCQSKPGIRLSELENVLVKLSDELNIMKEKMVKIVENPVPIGFIYVQLPYNAPPHDLWPLVKWNIISDLYSGVFFRTEGGSSAPFGGSVQPGSSSRLEKVEYQNQLNDQIVGISVPANGTGSDAVYIGGYPATGIKYDFFRGLRFYNSEAETRPVNVAVRIWERVA